MRRLDLLPLLPALCALIQAEDFPYRQPPKNVLEALNAPPTPAVSVSPQRGYAMFLGAVRYPPLREVAQPMLRLAGIRVDANTNALHLAPYYVSYTLKRLPGGEEIHIALPPGAKVSAPVWSPDDKQFAFTNVAAHEVELWVATSATGAARRLAGRLNAARLNAARLDAPTVQWLGDSRTLMVSLVPSDRGAPPPEPAFPKGPHVQESLGDAGPAPTYEDLLSTPRDEDLFDYYATAQVAYVDAASGRTSLFGKPGIFTTIQPSPDGQHVLMGRLRKPYSYQLPANLFPQEVEVWDRNAKTEFKAASLPMAAHIPLAGVRTGPRSYQWLPDKPASLIWVEALDGGNPKEKAPHRDKILSLSAPFSGQPHEIFETEERFREFTALAGGKALVQDYERVHRIERILEIDLEAPGAPAKVIFRRNERDAYHDPGTPVMKISLDGRRQPLQQGEEIYLTGRGASPSGDLPFLDRFNLATGKAERLFHSSSGYEEVVAVLDDAGSRLLTRRESPADPPNYFIRAGAALTPLTHFANPAPQPRA